MMFPIVPHVPQGKEDFVQLRPYQQECLDNIPDSGSYLIQMATGLGKTVTFASVPRRGKMLILSHREELVHQPLKYFNCSTGVEMATAKSNGEEVVSASVQSIVRRLDRFRPDEFDIIITDEAHHAAAKTYRRIYNHFNPRLHLGFTATPNRSDSVRLDDIYQDIIFQRDLRWGIENDYLSDIYCKRIDIGYDLSAVRTQHGDYAPGELDKAMDGTADAIAEAYRDHAKGATLIFAVSVDQVKQIVDRIPGAVAVTAETKNRSDIIAAFTRREIPCLVNCMVFTEGTDIPLVETVIIARPTQSDSLYAQMVGRGLRRHPDKQILHLIDCVGVTGKASLCTAPSLLGVDIDQIPKSKTEELQGMLFDLPEMAIRASDTPESWIRNVEIVHLWAKKQKYNTHNINWFRLPDQTMICSLPEGRFIKIPPVDELGMVQISGNKIPMQKALDQALIYLNKFHEKDGPLWDLQAVKRWGSGPASDKQMQLIKRRLKDFDKDLTKGEASMILNRLIGGKKSDRGARAVDFIQMVNGGPAEIPGVKADVPYSERWKTRQDRGGAAEKTGSEERCSRSVPAGWSTWV